MYETILVPTDGSTGADAALDEAVGLAAQFGATVHSLYVVDTTALGSEGSYVELAESFERIGEETTGEAVERAESTGVDAVDAVETGTPHRAILEYVDDHGVDLVVMGTHGRTGLERFLLGSVTEKVVRTVDVPVLTVRAPPTDDEDGDERADGAESDGTVES